MLCHLEESLERVIIIASRQNKIFGKRFALPVLAMLMSVYLDEELSVYDEFDTKIVVLITSTVFVITMLSP